MRPDHPVMGQEYTVLEPDEFLSSSVNTAVPIGYDDLGNLQVDVFGEKWSGKTMLWSEQAFVEMIENETLKSVRDVRQRGGDT